MLNTNKGVNWIYLAEGWDKWCALFEHSNELRASAKCKEFCDWLTDWRASLWKVWVVRNFPAATGAFMKMPLSETPSQYRPLYTITSTKPTSFLWTTFSASVTHRTYVHLSHIIAGLCKQTNAGTSTALTVVTNWFNPLNPKLNPICYLLALLGAHHFLHVSRIWVKSLTLRLLMSYIYGAPILDVSRSHTTTQHSR